MAPTTAVTSKTERHPPFLVQGRCLGALTRRRNAPLSHHHVVRWTSKAQSRSMEETSQELDRTVAGIRRSYLPVLWMWAGLPPILRPSLDAAAGFGHLAASGLCLGATLSGALSSVRSAPRRFRCCATPGAVYASLRALAVPTDEWHDRQGGVEPDGGRLGGGQGRRESLYPGAAAQAGPHRDHRPWDRRGDRKSV